MSFTNAGETLALQTVLDDSYIALFTSPPNEAGTGGTEVSGGGYSRKTWSVDYTGGNPTSASNSDPVNFSATGNWGTVSHAVVMSAATGGSALVVLELVDPSNPSTPLPKAISSGDDLQFAVGEILVTLE